MRSVSIGGAKVLETGAGAMSDEDPRPEGARVTTAMIGSAITDQPVVWDERESMLYALGVGAGLGAPERELGFTTENTGGVVLKAVPSFLTILTVGHTPPAMTGLDVGRFLHAEQKIELFRPLPPSGRGRVSTRIESVLDKGSGAIIGYVATLSDEDGAPIGAMRSSIFVRGAGGFGGERGTADAWSIPERRADVRIAYETRPEQALLYRLSGDRHRLHSDPEFARERGFPRPILHGLGTFGFACRALVEGFCDGDPDSLQSMEARFSRPVLPGETLVTEIWRLGDGRAAFRMVNPDGDVVLNRGQAARS